MRTDLESARSFTQTSDWNLACDTSSSICNSADEPKQKNISLLHETGAPAMTPFMIWSSIYHKLIAVTDIILVFNPHHSNI